MRDEEQGHVQLVAQAGEQIEQRALRHGIKCGSGLVGDQQLRPMCESHGDGDPLALAAADLRGIAEEERVSTIANEAPYEVEEPFGAGAGMSLNKQAALAAQRQEGIEGESRLLQKDCDAAAAQLAEPLRAGGQKRFPVEVDRPLDGGSGGYQSQDGSGDGGLAAA